MNSGTFYATCVDPRSNLFLLTDRDRIAANPSDLPAQKTVALKVQRLLEGSQKCETISTWIPNSHAEMTTARASFKAAD